MVPNFCSIFVGAFAEEWQKEILASVCLYGALVDANMLCFLWPRELNPYRVCFISGPLTKPLVSCFEPPPSVLLGNTASENPADTLTEVIIRCSGDHFTLLRPVNPQPGSGGNSPKGFQVGFICYSLLALIRHNVRCAFRSYELLSIFICSCHAAIVF